MFSKKMTHKMCAGLMMATMMAMPLTANAASYGTAKDGANNVPVTVTYAGSAARAMIPDKIEFSGKTGTYNVIAYSLTDEVADLDMNLSIVPSTSFELTSGSKSVTATVSQQKTVFSPSDLAAGEDDTMQASINGGEVQDVAVKKVMSAGTITANDLTSGTWNGTIVFTVG